MKIFLAGFLAFCLLILAPPALFSNPSTSTGCLSFDGVYDYVEVPHSEALNLSTAVTIECWIKTFSIPSYVFRIMGKHEVYNGYSLGMNGDTLGFGIENGPSAENLVFAETYPVPGVWYHIAGTFDGSVLKIYVNGVLENTEDYVGPIGTNTNVFSLGNFGWGGSGMPPNCFLHGLIDDASVYNVALTAEQIAAIYNCKTHPTEGLVAHWDFNDGSGSILTDSAGSNNGTLLSPAWTLDHRPNDLCGPTPVPLTSTGCLSFDGSDDYIEVPHSEALNLSTAVTIECWIKTFSIPSYVFRIMGKHEVYNGYSLGMNGDTLGFGIENGPAAENYVFAETYPVPGVWYHIAGTFDGSILKMYVNGELEGTKDYIGTIGTNTNVFSLGNFGWGGSGMPPNCFLHGLIDDASVYNVALTAEQIAAIYSCKVHPAEGLVAHWNFNDGSGSTLADSAGSNDGTLLSPAWTLDHRPNDLCDPTPAPQPLIPIIESGDYDGDGTSDIAIFRGSSGLWAVRGLGRIYFGVSGDIPISGDYDGDGTTDIAIFRGSSGLWVVRNVTRVYYGSSSDIPIPGDYNGDGSCDVGIFRSTSGLWAVTGVTRAYFGSSGDLPVPGDYNGDGTKDIALFRGSSGLWAIQNLPRVYYGSTSDNVVPGDYDGDGTWEVGIFRPNTGMWGIRGVTRAYYGSTSDQPVPADFDGDGLDDTGIFRPSSGLWAIRDLTRAYFGTPGDLPVTR